MGYTEEAKIQLAEAKKRGNADALALAQVYSTLALLKALDELSARVSELAGIVDEQTSTLKRAQAG